MNKFTVFFPPLSIFRNSFGPTLSFPGSSRSRKQFHEKWGWKSVYSLLKKVSQRTWNKRCKKNMSEYVLENILWVYMLNMWIVLLVPLLTLMSFMSFMRSYLRGANFVSFFSFGAQCLRASSKWMGLSIPMHTYHITSTTSCQALANNSKMKKENE